MRGCSKLEILRIFNRPSRTLVSMPPFRGPWRLSSATENGLSVGPRMRASRAVPPKAHLSLRAAPFARKKDPELHERRERPRLRRNCVEMANIFSVQGARAPLR